jgi:hypothetical protein
MKILLFSAFAAMFLAACTPTVTVERTSESLMIGTEVHGDPAHPYVEADKSEVADLTLRVHVKHLSSGYASESLVDIRNDSAVTWEKAPLPGMSGMRRKVGKRYYSDKVGAKIWLSYSDNKGGRAISNSTEIWVSFTEDARGAIDGFEYTATWKDPAKAPR